MIKSLEELAQARDFNRQHWGDKAAQLAEFIVDIEEQKFACVKPSGYVVDTDSLADEGLRTVFEDLVKRIGTQIEHRKVGALYCRSSGVGEYSGENLSLPVLYDANDHEQSWQRFKEAFFEVRNFKKIKPVLLQVLVGDIISTDGFSTRKIHEYAWPGLPKSVPYTDLSLEMLPDFAEQTTNAILEAMKKVGLTLPEYKQERDDEHSADVSGISSLRLSLYVENGPHITNFHLDSLHDLHSGDYVSGMLFCVANSSFQDKGYFLNDNNEVLDKDGNILLKKGTRVSIGLIGDKNVYSIGGTNMGFAVRSHDYHEPSFACIKSAWGLTSYLMGSERKNSLKSKAMLIDYFDPETGEHKERINLGHDFLETYIESYVQRYVEAFSIDTGTIEITYNSSNSRKYPVGVSKEVLRIARFYHQKHGIEIELEGCMKNRQLHIWQITDSALPKEVITHLTRVPDENIIYQITIGRGAINHQGHVIIAEDENYKKLAEQFEHQGEHCLILGFDDSITQEKSFLYLATVGSISNEREREYGKSVFTCLDEHMWGIACQTTFHAAQENRQGGMYYLDQTEPFVLAEGFQAISKGVTGFRNRKRENPFAVRSFIESITPHLEIIDGVKVLRNVHVEACREGLQIYKTKQNIE